MWTSPTYCYFQFSLHFSFQFRCCQQRCLFGSKCASMLANVCFRKETTLQLICSLLERKRSQLWLVCLQNNATCRIYVDLAKSSVDAHNGMKWSISSITGTTNAKQKSIIGTVSQFRIQTGLPSTIGKGAKEHKWQSRQDPRAPHSHSHTAKQRSQDQAPLHDITPSPLWCGPAWICWFAGTSKYMQVVCK